MQMLAEWAELVLALLSFLGAHMVPASPRVRAALVAGIGRTSYIAIYSVLSVLLLAWVARAAANAPFVELWPYEPGLVVAPLASMAIVCLLLAFGLTSPNPLSLGRSEGYDPRAPGIAAVVRHPVLWAALIWASSHLMLNGDLAHLLVFGAFGLLAVGGMLALDRRARKRLGEALWEEFARYTANLPFVGLMRGARVRFGMTTVLRSLAAVALYGTLVISHELLTGVPVPAHGG